MPTSIRDPISGAEVLSFDGLSAPVAHYTTNFSHDLAQHKKPDVDGARLEATGRNPLVISARLQFRNGAVFDLSANTSSPLYPDVFKDFLLRCADGSTGDLIHPELGFLRAKCASFNSVVDAARRDGADVDVTFIEDNEENDSGDLGVVSPLAFATYSALALDAALATLSVQSQELAAALAKNNITSFSDTLRNVRAVTDSVTLLQRQGAAIIPSMQHDLQVTKDSLATLGDVSTNTAKNAAERLQAALFLVQQSLLVTKAVTLYITPSPMTLAALAATLKTKVTDLVTLNPSLANTFPPGVVPPLSKVRYYA